MLYPLNVCPSLGNLGQPNLFAHQLVINGTSKLVTTTEAATCTVAVAATAFSAGSARATAAGTATALPAVVATAHPAYPGRRDISLSHNTMKPQERYRIGELVRRDFCPPLGIVADDDEVIDAVLQQNFVPIVDDRGCFCGIVTRRSVIAALANAEAALIGKAI